ncbi:hypothetical protein M569_17325 [Genlisea aurea]|uniref:DUF4378 domain-containing protein n=1 Tax=Genlisea aurea TaxID=192259 RepID=S8DDQ9_9LAMI|nr:hypothetical protein M569_17325 [Genlisea aurea]
MAKRSSSSSWTQIQKRNELRFIWGLSTAVDSCRGRRLNDCDLIFPVMKCYVSDHHHHHHHGVHSVEKRVERKKKKNGDRRHHRVFRLVDNKGGVVVSEQKVSCGCSSMAVVAASRRSSRKKKGDRLFSLGGMTRKLMDAFLGTPSVPGITKGNNNKSQLLRKKNIGSKTTTTTTSVVKRQENEAKRQLSLRLKKNVHHRPEEEEEEEEEESITTLNHILFQPRAESRRCFHPHGWIPGKMVAENIPSGEGPSNFLQRQQPDGIEFIISGSSSSSTDDGVDNHQLRHESPVSVLENGFSPPRISLEIRSAAEQKRLQPLELDFEDFSIESSSSSFYSSSCGGGGDDQQSHHLSHYVDLVMQVSCFDWNNLSEMKSPPEEELLLPYSIFDRVEDSLRCRCCCFGFSRKLLFDHINEVLTGMRRSHFACLGSAAAPPNRRIRPAAATSLAGAVTDRIMAHSDFYLLPPPQTEERRRGLDLIVSEDVAEHRSWFDSRVHVERVANEVSEDVLQECFTDMLREFVM